MEQNTYGNTDLFVIATTACMQEIEYLQQVPKDSKLRSRIVRKLPNLPAHSRPRVFAASGIEKIPPAARIKLPALAGTFSMTTVLA